MDFEKDNVYELIEEFSLFELEKDGTCSCDVESQEGNDDPGAVTIELRNYLINNGFVRNRVVGEHELDDFFLPAGTRLLKIANTSGDGMDSYERFVFEGTNIQVILCEDAGEYEDFVKEV